MNVVQLLDMARSCFPDRLAITNGRANLTYDDIFNLSARAAAQIRGSDIQHVGMIDTASPALPVALFAAAWAGKPFAPLNYRLSELDMAKLLERIAPALVVCGQDYGVEAHGELCEELEQVSRDDLLAAGNGDGFAADDLETWHSNPDEIAVLLFTSGTTGGPKAAILRHRNLFSYVTGTVEFMSAGPDEAVLTSVPPYHIAAMANLLSSIYAGRRIVQLPNFDADVWIDLVAAEKVTHAMVVPTMLTRIADRLEQRGDQLPTLASVSYGGGKTSRATIEKILALLPHTDFVNAYGLTETSSTVAVLGPAEHREAVSSDDPEVRARLGSAGRPLPTLEVTIRDEQGREVATGESGEIWIRGEQVSGEYRDTGSQKNDEGWFHTNDGGRFDEAGFLYIEGRLDDVIIRGGENISPGEIEDVILSHDAVADAAVVGMPDRDWGEKIVALVVLRDGAADSPTEAELTEFVKAKLRSLKSPDSVIFRDELPYNATGKLLRQQLREELADN